MVMSIDAALPDTQCEDVGVSSQCSSEPQRPRQGSSSQSPLFRLQVVPAGQAAQHPPLARLTPDAVAAKIELPIASGTTD
jgi:hypothetical protein